MLVEAVLNLDDGPYLMEFLSVYKRITKTHTTEIDLRNQLQRRVCYQDAFHDVRYAWILAAHSVDFFVSATRLISQLSAGNRNSKTVTPPLDWTYASPP